MNYLEKVDPKKYGMFEGVALINQYNQYVVKNENKKKKNKKDFFKFSNVSELPLFYEKTCKPQR